MSKQEKKQRRLYDLLKAEIKPKYFRNNWSFLWPLSSSDLNPLDYALRGFLENKTNAISHPNIGSPKTAIEEGWNKMTEEFILKACKSFRKRVGTIIEKKNDGYIQ